MVHGSLAPPSALISLRPGHVSACAVAHADAGWLLFLLVDTAAAPVLLVLLILWLQLLLVLSVDYRCYSSSFMRLLRPLLLILLLAPRLLTPSLQPLLHQVRRLLTTTPAAEETHQH